MSGLVSKVVRCAQWRGADKQAGAATRRASVERYLIGVRPVLINVFVGDLVEIFVPPACRHGVRQGVRPSLPSRKPVRDQHGAMLSSARPCH
ncbi:hypothetical protein FU139_21370 [Burkholderia territorii]|nr:hypothetical protein FU139_21370 [Burkholderia territorii]